MTKYLVVRQSMAYPYCVINRKVYNKLKLFEMNRELLISILVSRGDSNVQFSILRQEKKVGKNYYERAYVGCSSR